MLPVSPILQSLEWRRLHKSFGRYLVEQRFRPMFSRSPRTAFLRSDTTGPEFTIHLHLHSPDDCASSRYQIFLPPLQRFQKLTLMKHVHFDSVEIVELAMIRGDHPACKVGPPVQISWEVQGRTKMTVEDYEAGRDPIRKSLEDMRLSSSDRRSM